MGRARGGGEYDVSDADIEAFYQSLRTGSGGDPPKGSVVSELIVKHFHGEFTPQGFKRYSGLWKGPPPGTVGKKDIAIGMASLKEQMANPQSVPFGKRALLVAKQANVNELFDSVNWDV